MVSTIVRSKCIKIVNLLPIPPYSDYYCYHSEEEGGAAAATAEVELFILALCLSSIDIVLTRPSIMFFKHLVQLFLRSPLQQEKEKRIRPLPRTRHRSRIDIVGEMLQAANGIDIPKTRIMYKALLGYEQLKELLTELTEYGLLDYNEKTHTFRTTEKGIKVLKLYNQLTDMMKPQ